MKGALICREAITSVYRFREENGVRDPDAVRQHQMWHDLWWSYAAGAN